MTALDPAPAPAEPEGALSAEETNRMCDFLLGWFDRTNLAFFPGCDEFDVRPSGWAGQRPTPRGRSRH